ncbi:MAG: hypothetical protein AB7V01_22770 [Vicinamibacterales bacterium]
MNARLPLDDTMLTVTADCAGAAGLGAVGLAAGLLPPPAHPQATAAASAALPRP